MISIKELLSKISEETKSFEKAQFEFQKKTYDVEILKTQLLYVINAKLAEEEVALKNLASCAGFFDEKTIIVNVVPVVEGKVISDYKIAVDLIDGEVEVVENAFLENGLLQPVEKQDVGNDVLQAYKETVEISKLIEGVLNGN